MTKKIITIKKNCVIVYEKSTNIISRPVYMLTEVLKNFYIKQFYNTC